MDRITAGAAFPFILKTLSNISLPEGNRSRSEPAINGETCACDVRGLGTRQVRDHRSNLIDVGITGQCDELLECFGELALGGIHIRIGSTGLNIVNGDAARPEVTRQSFDESHERGL